MSNNLVKEMFILTLESGQFYAYSEKVLWKFPLADMKEHATLFHFPDEEPIRWGNKTRKRITDKFLKINEFLRKNVFVRIDGFIDYSQNRKIVPTTIHF